MPIEIGKIEALFRYPVKSMSGEPLEVADLGWHGLDGDRRLAFRRVEDRGGFPWLTATKLPELILFAPLRRQPVADGNLPTHVRTPAGEELEMFGEELAADVARRHGSPVEMMHLDRGIFDEASVSVITSATIGEIGKRAAQPPDVRRFRPNILIESLRSVPFEEDDWVGGVLSFGETTETPAIGRHQSRRALRDGEPRPGLGAPGRGDDEDDRSRERQQGGGLRHRHATGPPRGRTTRILRAAHRASSATLNGAYSLHRFVLRVLALAIIPGCTTPENRNPIDPIAFDEVATDVERLGWSSAGLATVHHQADSLGAAAVLVVTSGEVVLRRGDVAKNYRAHSIRKSFLSALYGIAIENGQIDTTRTLEELGIDEATPLTESENRATIADLLSGRSGIYLPAASEVASARDGRPERHQYEPGSHWHYNNWDHNVLGSIYRQETGDDIFEAFDRHIAIPIGMQDYELSDTRYQLEEVSIHPSYKFRMSTRDLARFGLLYLEGGRARGTSIVPESWVSTSTRSHSITGRSGTKAGYGLMWWVYADTARKPALSGPPAAFTASGTGGHRLTVIPAIDTVLVFRTDTDDSSAARIGSSTYDRFVDCVLRARLPSGEGSD